MRRVAFGFALAGCPDALLGSPYTTTVPRGKRVPLLKTSPLTPAGELLAKYARAYKGVLCLFQNREGEAEAEVRTERAT